MFDCDWGAYWFDLKVCLHFDLGIVLDILSHFLETPGKISSDTQAHIKRLVTLETTEGNFVVC